MKQIRSLDGRNDQDILGISSLFKRHESVLLKSYWQVVFT